MVVPYAMVPGFGWAKRTMKCCCTLNVLMSCDYSTRFFTNKSKCRDLHLHNAFVLDFVFCGTNAISGGLWGHLFGSGISGHYLLMTSQLWLKQCCSFVLQWWGSSPQGPDLWFWRFRFCGSLGFCVTFSILCSQNYHWNYTLPRQGDFLFTCFHR